MSNRVREDFQQVDLDDDEALRRAIEESLRHNPLHELYNATDHAAFFPGALPLELEQRERQRETQRDSQRDSQRERQADISRGRILDDDLAEDEELRKALQESLMLEEEAAAIRKLIADMEKEEVSRNAVATQSAVSDQEPTVGSSDADETVYHQVLTVPTKDDEPQATQTNLEVEAEIIRRLIVSMEEVNSTTQVVIEEAPCLIDEKETTEDVADPKVSETIDSNQPIEEEHLEEEEEQLEGPVVVQSDGELEDEWECVQLQDCETDEEGSIAEPDIVFPISPLKLSNSSTTAPVDNVESGDDEDVLANAHLLLEDSDYAVIERRLQEESEEYIESVLQEHERDLQSSCFTARSEELEVTGSPMVQSNNSTASASQIPVVVATDLEEDVPRAMRESTRSLSLGENSLRCPVDVFQLLQKGKHEFERVYGVKLSFSDPKECVVTVNHSDPDMTMIGLEELRLILRDSDPFEQQLSELTNQNTHIFVDNSNIFIGAQITGFNRVLRRLTYDRSVRVNIKELHDVVNHGRSCKRMYVVGSSSANNAWVKRWEHIGYKSFIHPLGVDGKESGVDSALVAEITIHIGKVQRQRIADPLLSAAAIDTLVLLTGDGNDNDGNASLFAAVEHALDLGWKVELWCWRLSVSKNYRRLADKYAATGRFVLKFLDNYREGIVFQGKQHHK